MAISWGPRGYPGPQGLTGPVGSKGDKGDAGQGVIVANNGNGSYTITGANGSIVIFDGEDGVAPAANSGTYLSMVYAEVVTGSAAPTITPGTGSYDGTNEIMPTGSATWAATPQYTIGNTTYVSINRYVHNGVSDTWSLVTPNWSAAVVYSVNVNPSNRFTSYVFLRSITTPATPTGGSYASPVPSGWSDGIPTGTEPVYISKRLFTEDGQSPQDAAWSAPALLGADGDSAKFQFGPTNTGPWNDVPANGDEWMITCTRAAGGAWVCDTANPVRIVGETGPEAQSKHLASAFKRSDTDLAALNGGIGEIPEGGNYDAPYPVDNGSVSGWTANIPSGTANLYLSTRLFTSDGLAPQDANWAGAQLFSGENASNFVVTADSQVFAYNTDGSITPSSITFTANKQHIGNDTNWTTDPDSSGGIAADATNQDTYTITSAEFDALGLDVLKVIGTAGTFTDAVTIAKVSDGSAALTGLLTNEVDSVFADVTGDPTFAGDEGGEFLMYIGADNAVSDSTFTVNGSSSQTKNGLRMAINANSGVYTVTESGSWTTDRETFDLIATYTPTGSTVTKSYTLTKSKEGAIGVQGTSTRIDIAYGTTGSGGSVNYPSLSWPGGTRTYTSASSTGKTFMGTNALTWDPDEGAPDYNETLVSTNPNDYEWTEIVGGDGTDGTNGLSSRLDIAYADTYNGVTASGNLRFPSNSSNPTPATPAASNTYIGTDIVTWDSSTTAPNASQNQATYEWTRYQGDDGQSGVDSLSISLSNPSHTVPCDDGGTVTDYNNSGTLITVYEGPVALDSVTDGSTATMSNGEFRLVSAVTSGGITADPSPAYTGDPITFGAISGWASGTGNLTAKITYTVEGKTANGTVFSGLVAEQTFSKNIGGGGTGGSQINTSLTGLIHGTSVTVNHASQNNSMTVNWNVNTSSFEFTQGAGEGNDPPTGTVTVNLKRNGTTVDSYNLDLESDTEPGNNYWIMNAPLQTYVSSAQGTGNVEWKIEWSGDTSSDTLFSDQGYVSVTETL